MSLEKCHICHKEIGTFGWQEPSHMLIITAKCSSVGEVTRQFRVCDRCGEKALIDYARDPLAQRHF
jgi:hypothetical protein